MTLPNFLIIGAPKSGTTTLHYALSQHPQVFMCPVKEAGFFWAYGQEVDLHGPGTAKLHNRLISDRTQYEKLFEPAGGCKAIGESSVRYLSTARAPQVIHDLAPQMKLVAILRQPAERAFSAFMHNLRDGLEPCSEFAEAIAQDRDGRRDDWLFCRYLNRGFYYASLKRYLEYFDREQLHISLLEDLKEDPNGLMRGLLRFLEVDEGFLPDLSHKHNVSGVIRNPALRWLWTRSNEARAALRPLLPPRLRHAAFEWVIQDLEKLPFPPEQRAELTEYYRPDILGLQDLLGRDLSHWL
jgi:hypothetical protein